jgi:glycosyltransferase involved in cell wall biosynthesis
MGSLKISVAMCTFNGAPFLSAQLESIATQNRLPDELLICDDGSSDGSLDVVREFARRAPFATRLIVNPRNLGSTRNFEQAISLCDGEIVVLADQDDIWYPYKLQRIESAFLRSNEIVATFSDADLIDAESRLLNGRLWGTVSFGIAEQKRFARGDGLRVLIKHPVVTGATMAFRRKLFDLATPVPVNEIHDRWITFLLAAVGPFEVIAEPLMQYRRHTAQQVGPGPMTPRESISQARSRGAEFYFEEIVRYRQFYERLQARRNDFPFADNALNEIEKKVLHLEHRAKMPDARMARVPRMLGEAVNGHYWRYSGGWRSLAKDFLLR